MLRSCSGLQDLSGYTHFTDIHRERSNNQVGYSTDVIIVKGI